MDELKNNENLMPKALAPKTSVRPLTAKNKAFLQHLADGRPTIEAYKLAGYQGEAHAAYQLRSDLKVQLQHLLENGGFSREQLGSELNRLNALPLDPSIKNVNFKQKIDLLRLMDKALPKPLDNQNKPKITPFLIGINNPESVTINELPSPMVDSMEGTDGTDDGMHDLSDMEGR